MILHQWSGSKSFPHNVWRKLSRESLGMTRTEMSVLGIRRENMDLEMRSAAICIRREG